MPRTNALTAIGGSCYRGANALLGRAECLLADGGDRPLPHRPILIVGPPRSGSTLLMQLLTDCLDVGYLTNTHAWLHGAPSWMERIIRSPRRRRSTDYASTHGRARGWLAPSECGHWWYRFFRRRPQHVSAAEADPRAMQRLRAAVRALTLAFDRPVLFKNVVCTVRLDPIGHALPEALFLVIRRDEADNARSLLHGRHRVFGGYDRWWSAEPPDVQTLRTLPPVGQVVGQVRSLHALIDRAREAHGSERFLDIAYHQLCEDPASIVERVVGFAASHDTPLHRRAEPPAAFEVRRPPRLPEAMERQLAAALADDADRHHTPELS